MYAVHGLDVMGQERALAAGGRRGPDPGVAGELEDLDGWRHEVIARPEHVDAVEPGSRAVGDHGRVGYDERHGPGSQEQPVVGRPVDVQALEDAAEQTDPHHPTEHLAADAELDRVSVRERSVGGQLGMC